MHPLLRRLDRCAALTGCVPWLLQWAVEWVAVLWLLVSWVPLRLKPNYRAAYGEGIGSAGPPAGRNDDGHRLD